MKRFLIILLSSFLLPVTVYADGIRKGYRGFVDASFGATSFRIAEDAKFNSNDGWTFFDVHRQGFVSAGISTSHGYQFNPHLFVGLGVLGEYQQISNFVYLGTFLHVRTDQTFGRYTPYAEIRTGLKTDGFGAFFFTPAVGYRFNFGHRTNLNLGAGVNFQYRPDDCSEESVIHYGYNWPGPDYLVVGKVSVLKPSFDFKVGIDF